jgi:hypothetical protein
MNIDEEPDSWSSSYWTVQPKWLKRLTIFIALPAWLAVVASIIGGNPSRQLIVGCVGIIIMLAVLQAAFVARAYWKHEI